MAKKGRPAKGPFDDLAAEFKDAAQSMSEQEVRDLVAKVAMAEEENKKNMKEDQHLQECKLQCKEASAQYREASKQNSLKVRFLKDVLEGRGKATV
jgi:hypothetical protein